MIFISKQGKILLLVGKSGSGKDTIAQLLAQYFGCRVLKSYTTRKQRYPGEDTHRFVPSLNWWMKRNDGSDYLVAYTAFDGEEYWATGSQIEESDVYVIDPDGLQFLRESYRGQKKLVVAYLDVDALTRFERMLCRGDSVRNAIRRLMHDAQKFRGAKNDADYVMRNDNLAECIEQLAFHLKLYPIKK